MPDHNEPESEMVTPVNSLPPGSLWWPVQGSEVAGLITHLSLDRDSSDRLVAEATTILSKCIPPTRTDTTTGLVLGYVQSGKTMSFTTVAALARDNGYPMVVVITGIATNLLGQSTRRLENDLRLQNNRKWRLFLNPRPDQADRIADVLADWRDADLPDHRRQTVLVTVLKNTTHLRNLVDALRQLDLRNVPVLVIDDEADQAGLNTLVNQGRNSGTYQRLVALRQILTHHTYLQYTATPQAPLLINVIDTLSPRFAEPLTPGSEYAGGEAFFEENQALVRVIPPAEIPSRANPLRDVPASLISALKLFFLGVAAGFAAEDDGKPGQRNRSMLVHPSRETPGHGQFYNWITQIRQQWLTLLALPPNDPERVQFLSTFATEYADLRQTVPALLPLDRLQSHLAYAIRKTNVLEVNARPITPQPDWRDTYPWILVGGQAMDRGFTVEGLTVTYMPRDMGVGNADTIQQRARFFGYKRSYLGFCRVYLEQGVRDAFEFYVAHERDIRRRLIAHREGGRPLSEWRRAFFLDTSLRPTRRQVLNLDYRQDTVSDDWYWPKVPHGTTELISANQTTVRDFVQRFDWHPDAGDPRRTPEQIHLVVEDVRLKQAYEDLLMPLRLTDERDSQLFTGLLLQIEDYLQRHSDTVCTIYQMSGGNRRVRSVNQDEEIPTLFQGANYANGAKRDVVYPGDERVRAATGISIQIHTLEVHSQGRGSVVASNVPAIAVWVPAAMAREWLVQERQ